MAHFKSFQVIMEKDKSEEKKIWETNKRQEQVLVKVKS